LRYTDAELLVERNREVNPLKDRIAWIDRAKELAKKDSEFKKVILLSDDILELSKALDINKYDYVVYDKFYAYLKLGNSSAAFVLAKRIEDVFSGDKRNISVFKKVVLEYQKLDEKDEFINYAQKIIVLQDKIGIHEESPWIEFVLMDKYIETKRFDEALSLSFKLGKEKLTELQKVQMFYIRSTIYQAQKNTIRQRKILEKCVKIDVKSKWATLCSKTLSIIK
jgi:tetratricopeptide (TPR) repeat protein